MCTPEVKGKSISADDVRSIAQAPLSLYESRPFLHQSRGQGRGEGSGSAWDDGSGFKASCKVCA